MPNQDQFIRQDVIAQQDLEVQQNLNVDGNVVLGDNNTDTVTITGSLTQGVVVSESPAPTEHGPGPLTNEVLYTFDATEYRGAVIAVQLIDEINSDFYMATLSVVHDGSSAFLSTASVVADGWGGTNPTFSAAINAGDVELRCTTADAISYASVIKADLFETVAGPAITFTVPPTNEAVTAPAPATFNLVATTNDGGVLTYQWEVDDGLGGGFVNATGGVYSGDTTDTLTVTDSTGLNGYDFRCVVTSSATASPATSVTVSLTVS